MSLKTKTQKELQAIAKTLHLPITRTKTYNGKSNSTRIKKANLIKSIIEERKASAIERNITNPKPQKKKRKTSKWGIFVKQYAQDHPEHKGPGLMTFASVAYKNQ